jgi:hypothetical protein
MSPPSLHLAPHGIDDAELFGVNNTFGRNTTTDRMS